MKQNIFSALMAMFSFSSCAQNQKKEIPAMETKTDRTSQLDTATFGAGCYCHNNFDCYIHFIKLDKHC